MKPPLKLDWQYKAPIAKVWSALTDSDTLARWVMPNDFKPVVGHKFQFRAEPVGGWDGIISSEVLLVEEPNRLSYTWVSGGEETTITWTLTETDDGKVNLNLEQAGFKSAQAYGGATYGWNRMAGELAKLLEA